MAKKEPLYPHMPKKKGLLYPHVTRGRKSESQFIEVGDRVRYIGTSKYRDETWPEDAWLEYGVTGTVTENHPRLPAFRDIEAIEAWATVTWDFNGETAIEAESEGDRWERIGSINLLAKTEGDPISKYCCSQCGECAPEELLEEGRFLDRINWLRQHYEERHPGMWGEMSPMTVEDGELVPPQYHHLADLVSEPLPKDAY